MNSNKPPKKDKQKGLVKDDMFGGSAWQDHIEADKGSTIAPGNSLPDTMGHQILPSDESATQVFQPDDPQKTTDFVLDPDATAYFASNGLPISKGKDRIDIPGYKILGELGRGAMGVVYKARQMRADRDVALKVMLHSDHARSEEIARFQVEAQSAARLQHPNIVQIHDVGQVGEIPYFTLEFVEGGTLARKMAKQMMTAEESAQMMHTLSKAMAYAHSKGVVHRDLKPANILVANDGTPKIADFGLARRTDDVSHLTIDGTILGTPNYMSPEQAAAKQSEIGPLSDVYTLGAILYEMLIGRPPFKGATAWEVILQVRTAEPTPPSTLQPGIARDLETICLKCLQKEPAKRYGSAQLLADDLQRYLNQEPILARPIGSIERIIRLARRYPREARLVGLVAGLLLLMTIGAASTAYRINQDRQHISLQRDQIKEQRDEIGKEKAISDQRLVTYRDTVSQLANQAPRLLQDAPLGAGTREEFVGLVKGILDSSEETDAIGPSRQWGLEAMAIRQGDLLLGQAVSDNRQSDKQDMVAEKLNAAAEQFQKAEKIAQEVFDQKPPEMSKAAANLAHALSRKATLGSVRNTPSAELAPIHKTAIELRRTALASESDDKKTQRKSELGVELLRYAEFILKIESTDKKYPLGAKEKAMEAVNLLRESIEELDKSDTIYAGALQDLGLSLRTLGRASERLGLDQEADAAYAEAVEIHKLLSADFPNRYTFRKILIDSANQYGDYLLGKRADPKRIEATYSLALDTLKKTLDTPELRSLQHGNRGLAMQYYRAGLVATLTGNTATAKSYFERCSLLRQVAWNDILADHRANANLDLAITQRIELMISMARSGQAEQAMQHADWLIERAEKLVQENNPKSLAGGFKAERLFVLAASGYALLTENLPLDQQPLVQSKAVEAIRKAIASGYRDVKYLKNDPDMQPLQGLPAFQQLIATDTVSK